LDRNIGYAMVPMTKAAEGTALTAVTEEGEREATVVPMPFVDPAKQIPKT
jgi:aminomethyltransferase